jgi:hypothetical protein
MGAVTQFFIDTGAVIVLRLWAECVVQWENKGTCKEL